MAGATAITAKDVAAGVRFVWDVQRFLRKRIPLSAARATVQHRVQHRAENLLAVFERAIYGQPNSPHLALLRRIGCEYGDVERLVAAEGVEGALLALYRQGVYLTVEEYKGKRPTVRGSMTISVQPSMLWNRVPGHGVTTQTSGSRSGGIAVPLDLVAAEQQSSSHALFYEARGSLHWSHGYWRVPGVASMIYLLQSCLFGVRARRWFSPVDPTSPALHPRYRWSARAMHAGSLLAARPLPLPEFAPMSAPRPIVDWMAGELRAGRTPNLVAYPSMAVRLCEVAASAGIDLTGAQFTLSGEPLTVPRLAAVQATGAKAVPMYGSGETGNIARGCIHPEAPDDLHLSSDVHAVIQPGVEGEAAGLPPRAMLLSSLQLSARLILLNVSTGDQAEMTRRPCDCLLGAVGLTTHLRNVRSFEKLTAGGMTFLDADVIGVLEEVLPRRFGGGPMDYQLLEDAGPDGEPLLRLLVHPRVGAVDEDALKRAFQDAIGGGSGVQQVMSQVWRDADFLAVERRAPEVSRLGKVQHVHSPGAAVAAE